MKLYSFLIATLLPFSTTSLPDSCSKSATSKNELRTGAEQTEKYLPLLKGKRVAMMANLTTIIGRSDKGELGAGVLVV